MTTLSNSFDPSVKIITVHGHWILTSVSLFIFADELGTPLKAAMEDLA